MEQNPLLLVTCIRSSAQRRITLRDAGGTLSLCSASTSPPGRPGINTLIGFTGVAEPGNRKFLVSQLARVYRLAGSVSEQRSNSGDRGTSRKTRKRESCINHALWLAAHSLHRSQPSHLGALRFGALERDLELPQGEHHRNRSQASSCPRPPDSKPAQPDDESIFASAEQQQQRRREQRHLRKQAHKYGIYSRPHGGATRLILSVQICSLGGKALV